MITHAMIAISIGIKDGSMVLFFNSLSYVKIFFRETRKRRTIPFLESDTPTVKEYRIEGVQCGTVAATVSVHYLQMFLLLSKSYIYYTIYLRFCQEILAIFWDFFASSVF